MFTDLGKVFRTLYHVFNCYCLVKTKRNAYYYLHAF